MSAFVGVLLTGAIALMSDGLNGRREMRRRRADLAERLFEQKRDAYLDYYLWAIEFWELMDDTERVLDASIQALPDLEHSTSLPGPAVAPPNGELAQHIQRLESYNGMRVMMARDAKVRFFGPLAVSDAARRFTAAMTGLQAATTLDLARALSVKLGGESEPDDASERAQIEQALNEAERAFLEAVKEDLGASL